MAHIVCRSAEQRDLITGLESCSDSDDTYIERNPIAMIFSPGTAV